MAVRSSLPPPGQLIGTGTNDNAAVGKVGEFVTATVASGVAVVLTTATPLNVTSISLTAGDWDVSGTVDFLPTATTSITQLNAAVSLTNNTLSTQPGGSGLGTDPLTVINQPAAVPAVSPVDVVIPPVRLSIAATTTVFLVAQGTFTVAALSAYGTIRARRTR